MRQSGALPEGIRHDRPSSLPTAQQIRRNPALGQTTVEHSCTQSREIATDSCNLIPDQALHHRVDSKLHLLGCQNSLEKTVKAWVIESHWESLDNASILNQMPRFTKDATLETRTNNTASSPKDTGVVPEDFHKLDPFDAFHECLDWKWFHQDIIDTEAGTRELRPTSLLKAGVVPSISSKSWILCKVRCLTAAEEMYTIRHIQLIEMIVIEYQDASSWCKVASLLTSRPRRLGLKSFRRTANAPSGSPSDYALAAEPGRSCISLFAWNRCI